MDPTAPYPYGWVRKPLRPALHLVLGVIAVFTSLVAAASAFDDSGRGREPIVGWIILVGCAVLAFGTARVAVGGVRLDPDGVFIRNDFRSRRLRWEAISSFSLPPGSTMLHVIATDGRVIPVKNVAGLNPVLFPRVREPYELLVDSLNARLRIELDRLHGAAPR